MKRWIRRALALTLVLVLILPFSVSASEATGDDGGLQFDCTSAILMDATTGQVLFEQNADEALPPASVTKIMTLLLVMEAIEAGIVSQAKQILYEIERLNRKVDQFQKCEITP